MAYHHPKIDNCWQTNCSATPLITAKDRWRKTHVCFIDIREQHFLKGLPFEYVMVQYMIFEPLSFTLELKQLSSPHHFPHNWYYIMWFQKSNAEIQPE